MTKKRLMVDDDYAWIDTATNTVIEIEDALDLVNDLANENEELKEEHRRIIDLLDKKLQENDDNDEYARRVKIDLIMELKKELGE